MVDTAVTEATGTEDGKKTGTALTGKGEPMSDLISRQAAIHALQGYEVDL